MRDLVGQRLGDFAIVRELGRGGMGVVYEARQVSLNRQVALKVLSGGLGLTSKAVQRFHREAEAAAKLHHTNIVPVYATGEEQGTHFYAMELIDGASLDRVIRQLRAGPGSDKPTGTASGNDGGLSPDLAYTDLKKNRKEIAKLFNRMPMGEYSPNVLMEQLARNVIRVRLTGQAKKGMDKWTGFDMILEKGNWRLRWFVP